MTQTINAEKLKAAAEHLEWVLSQYPNEPVVQALATALAPLIEAAKAGAVHVPLERVPFGYEFSDGAYMPFNEPNVGDAYARFSAEATGGLTEQDRRALARMQAVRDGSAING